MKELCTCKVKEKPIALQLEYIEYLPLKGGGHTGTMPLVCGLCGKLDFLPRENWDMFLERGEPETVKEWSDGFDEFIQSRRFVPQVKVEVKKAAGFFKSFWNTWFGGW